MGITFADNTRAIACIRKLDRARSTPCQAQTEAIWEITQSLNRLLTVRFCPKAENTEANWATRVFTDAGELMLDRELVSTLISDRDKPDIVIFSSKQNRQLDRFITRGDDRSAEGPDALALNWHDTNGRFFPLFSCLSREDQG